MEYENPWDVKSVYDLLVFKCPACIFLNTSKQKFVNHAFEDHPESIASLLNVSDGSLEDVLIPEDHTGEEDLENCDKTNIDPVKLEVYEGDVKQDTETNVNENYPDVELPKDDFKDVEESLETENISKLDDESNENCCKICGNSFKNKYILKHHMNVEHNDNKIIEDKQLRLELTLRGFICKTCDDTLFMSYHNLTNHVLLKHSSSLNQENLQDTICDKCCKEFSNRDEFSKHQAVEHCKFCYLCSQNFNSTKSLIAHLLQEHERFDTYCLKCEMFLKGTSQKLDHMKNCSEKFQCPLCPHSLSLRSTLKYHIRSEHSKATKTFDCVECNVSFKKIISLKKHMRRIHEGIIDFVTCDKCGEKFKGEDILRHHIKYVHNNEKDCKCGICGLMVQTKFALKKHIAAVHEKQKNVQCDQCGKEFFNKAGLLGHIKNAHEENQKQFQCEKCEKSFKSKTNLKLHFDRTHIDIKAFPCPKCDNSYVRKYLLEEHISNIHDGIKKFKCNECTSVFARADNLKTHVRVVHLGVKNFKCESCGKEFARSKYLERHKTSCH